MAANLRKMKNMDQALHVGSDFITQANVVSKYVCK